MRKHRVQRTDETQPLWHCLDREPIADTRERDQQDERQNGFDDVTVASPVDLDAENKPVVERLAGSALKDHSFGLECDVFPRSVCEIGVVRFRKDRIRLEVDLKLIRIERIRGQHDWQPLGIERKRLKFKVGREAGQEMSAERDFSGLWNDLDDLVLEDRLHFVLKVHVRSPVSLS